jgi:catechol 2,3-dioxygenase-like lactoylglutathione lyase family enzyme
MIASSNLQRSREFYVDTLGFPLVQDHPAMFAFRAGSVRFSVMGGGHRLEDEPEIEPNMTAILRTGDLDGTVQRLRDKGVSFLGDVQEAPGFMKHIALLDPDNNLLYIGEYFRDPLAEA